MFPVLYSNNSFIICFAKHQLQSIIQELISFCLKTYKKTSFSLSHLMSDLTILQNPDVSSVIFINQLKFAKHLTEQMAISWEHIVYAH